MRRDPRPCGSPGPAPGWRTSGTRAPARRRRAPCRRRRRRARSRRASTAHRRAYGAARLRPHARGRRPPVSAALLERAAHGGAHDVAAVFAAVMGIAEWLDGARGRLARIVGDFGFAYAPRARLGAADPDPGLAAA